MILMIDNYDSFTYNLVQYVCELGEQVEVKRNDQITIDEISSMDPAAIIISPGPRTPDEAGISLSLICAFAGKIPLLGVCLGHQAICQSFGATIIHAPELMHGKTSQIHHTGKGVFKDLPNPFTATRYHSLVADEKTLPDCLEITARTPDQQIMGVLHKQWLVEGVQFHPESIATDHGHDMLNNFLSRC